MTITKWINLNIDCNNFKNKKVLITGGNSGIGYELAKHCLSLGSNVYLLCRSKEKALKSIEELKSVYPDSNVSFIQLDLASFSSIKEASEQILKIDVDMFVNNAGVFKLPKSQTQDGLEIIMGTNYIGSLYLSSLLLPYFSKLNHKVHVVYESSLTSRLYKIDYDDFFMNRKYRQMRIYGQSKRCINNMFKYFSDEYNDSNIIFSLTHPGGTYTPLIAKGYRCKPFQACAKTFMRLFFHSPRKAALTILYALNSASNIVVGPRGILEISGFPKKTILPIDNDYYYCANYGLNFINHNITCTSGKVVIVTGASGGIGKETTSKLLQKGYEIIGLDLKPSDIIDTHYHHIYCDITSQDSINSAVNKIKEISDYIYMFYNLAGVFMLETLIEGNIDDLKKIIDINFFGVCQLTKSLFPLLHKGSKILIFSSEVARYSPQPFNGYYALSKVLVDRYADVLRRELYYLDIKVIKAQAGAIKTNLLSGVNGQYEQTLNNSNLYKEPLTKLKKLMDDEITKQVDPKLIADKLVKISFNKHPKINYKMKNSLKLRTLNKLPERVQDLIYKKVIK